MTSFLASGDFCRDPDQDPQNAIPNLAPNSLTL